MRRHIEVLGTRPTWLFSSGPLPGSTKEAPAADPVTQALGPTDGPGSGGRKKVEELASAIQPRGHAVFLGAFDPKDPPKAMSERFVRMMPMAKGILPPGDFRDWDAIEAWAREIAMELSPAPVG
jgi:menaquinone-dependent protoporphyrinogen oxidase